MPPTPQSIHTLFELVRLKIDHADRMTVARGETFNIFSILKVERAENQLHSNFIGELLNPHGSHQQGTRFLERFLEICCPRAPLDVESTGVSLEHYIGPIQGQNGGRIDIYLSDGKNSAIAIENKIDAGDQLRQIERYCNYQPFGKDNNSVLYLTLTGDPPSDESRQQKREGEDFHCISYEHHILKWLLACQKESADIPILHESIRQYRLLIETLTNTKSNMQEDAMIALIQENLEEASLVAQYTEKVYDRICSEFRDELFDSIKTALNDVFDGAFFATKDPADSTMHLWSKIWISFKNASTTAPRFGLESFSKKNHRPFFIGTFIGQNQDSKYLLLDSVRVNNKYWANMSEISAYNGQRIAFNSASFVSLIHTDDQFRKGLCAHITHEVVEYIKYQKQSLIAFVG